MNFRNLPSPAASVGLGLLAAMLALPPVGAQTDDKTPKGMKRTATGALIEPPSPEMRQWLEGRIPELKAMLEEARQGKRDEEDKYIFLRELIENEEFLERPETEEARGWKRERDEVLKRRPEFRPGSGRQPKLSEKRSAKERHKALEEKRKTWTPQDTSPIRCYRDGENMMVRYQYRLEFFKIKPRYTIRALPESDPISVPQTVEYEILDGGRTVKLLPYKTMTFEYPLNSGRPPIEEIATGRKAVAVCVDPLLPYFTRLREERELSIRGVHWRKPQAQHQGLCGVITIGGKIVWKMSVRQAPPTTYIKPLGVLDDGSEALFGIGQAEVVNDDGRMDIMRFSELVHWIAPGRVERRRIDGLPEEELRAYFKKFSTAIPR